MHPSNYGQASWQIDMLNGNSCIIKIFAAREWSLLFLIMDFITRINWKFWILFFCRTECSDITIMWMKIMMCLITMREGMAVKHCQPLLSNSPGTMVGTAPLASFYLYHTEDDLSEYPIEEHNWAAGAEAADSVGADVITSSLGYFLFDDSVFNITYQQLDGNTTMVTRAADFAASKGIIVCNAAGNEGRTPWFYIIAPADADSILTVGGVDSTGSITAFSSHGPASDGDIKPDVVARAINCAIVDPGSGKIARGSGTSFATPIMAGLMACLWQAHPR